MRRFASPASGDARAARNRGTAFSSDKLTDLDNSPLLRNTRDESSSARNSRDVSIPEMAPSVAGHDGRSADPAKPVVHGPCHEHHMFLVNPIPTATHVETDNVAAWSFMNAHQRQGQATERIVPSGDKKRKRSEEREWNLVQLQMYAPANTQHTNEHSYRTDNVVNGGEYGPNPPPMPQVYASNVAPAAVAGHNPPPSYRAGHNPPPSAVAGHNPPPSYRAGPPHADFSYPLNVGGGQFYQQPAPHQGRNHYEPANDYNSGPRVGFAGGVGSRTPQHRHQQRHHQQRGRAGSPRRAADPASHPPPVSRTMTKLQKKERQKCEDIKRQELLSKQDSAQLKNKVRLRFTDIKCEEYRARQLILAAFNTGLQRMPFKEIKSEQFVSRRKIEVEWYAILRDMMEDFVVACQLPQDAVAAGEQEVAE